MATELITVDYHVQCVLCTRLEAVMWIWYMSMLEALMQILIFPFLFPLPFFFLFSF